MIVQIFSETGFSKKLPPSILNNRIPVYHHILLPILHRNHSFSSELVSSTVACFVTFPHGLPHLYWFLRKRGSISTQHQFWHDSSRWLFLNDFVSWLNGWHVLSRSLLTPFRHDLIYTPPMWHAYHEGGGREIFVLFPRRGAVVT